MRSADRSDLRLAIQTAAALLIAHAIAFFLHEYSHAVAAWLLGFKANPLALNYGHLTLSNERGSVRLLWREKRSGV